MVYNTYDSYNNNYYNSKNINNIIMNLHKNNKEIKSNIQKKVSEDEYEIMIKSLFYKKPNYEKKHENNNNDINDIYTLNDYLIEKETENLLLEQKLNEMKIEFNKVKDNLEREIEQLKMDKKLNLSLIDSNSSETNEVKEYDDGRYNGRIVNNKREGIGTFYYIDGKIYKGEWKNDKIEGRGIMKYKKEEKEEEYEGEFKNNKKEGKGIMRYNNGDKYEGFWKDDKKEGKGTLYYRGGNIFEGYWKDDKKDGKGIVYGKDKRKMGDYLKGKPIGKHVILFDNGIVEVKDENNNI